LLFQVVDGGTTDGTPCFHGCICCSRCSCPSGLAERHAGLAADWLESAGYPRGQLNVPAAFLLELAAVLQLGEWERQNVLDHLDANLPSYRQAADELAARAALGLKKFHGPDATRLSDLVNTIWIERFAWDGPSMLQADIVFGNCDDDALVEQLTEFLWQHRVDLQKLTVNEAGDESQ
jgi:hypothetical protein